ncbi:MAG: phosphodiesterase [Thalassobium sp.]|nr:MAG: phosphodiesterase [Thalassobium sp.]
MHKVLVLTDLHIRSAGETIIGLDPLTRLRCALEHALARHADAAAMVLMGDLTHSGKASEYARLADALNDLPVPLIPMIGNHDVRAAFRDAFPTAPDADGFVQAVTDIGTHRLITLDTRNGLMGHRAHAGQICATRLAFLREALVGANGRVPLVFSHHPPMDIGLPGMDGIRILSGETDMLALLATHRAHLFCGHVHRTISGSTRGVPFTLFKSTCHQAPLDLRSHDSTISIDEPGAYGVLLLTDEGVVAHSEDVGLNGQIFTGPDALPDGEPL